MPAAPPQMGAVAPQYQQALMLQMQQNQLLMQQQAGVTPAVLAQYGGIPAVGMQAAVNTLQAASVYEQAVSDKIEPEVQEFADHFKLDERITKDLAIQLNRRNNTFEDDLESLYQILEGARSPAGLLRVKIREMEDGSFKGTGSPDKEIEELGKKYGLDSQAVVKLNDVLGKRPDRKKDLKMLIKHVELSNKPSALIMMMLKDLRAGKPIVEPEYPAAVGSYAHKRGLRRSERSRSRNKKKGRRKEKEERESSSSSPPPPQRQSRSRSRGAARSSGGPKPESVKGPRPMTLLERFG